MFKPYKNSCRSKEKPIHPALPAYCVYTASDSKGLRPFYSSTEFLAGIYYRLPLCSMHNSMPCAQSRAAYGGAGTILKLSLFCLFSQGRSRRALHSASSSDVSTKVIVMPWGSSTFKLMASMLVLSRFSSDESSLFLLRAAETTEGIETVLRSRVSSSDA